jgi:FAD-dependent oxidoreductase domain-containing protein 1
MECEVLIVGAGVLGLSSAYHIKRRDPSKRVIVIERLGGPGQGNTAKSMGAFRNIFTSETNFLLTDSTIDWLIHLQGELGHDLRLHMIGYLWLFSEPQYRRLSDPLSKIRARGTETTTFKEDELRKIIPDLVTDFSEDEEADLMGLEEVSYGVLGHKCGSLDADALAESYEQLFLGLGGEVHYGTEARRLLLKPREELGIPGEPFVWQEKGIAGVETTKGDICAETTIVACGAWAEGLLNPVGLDSFTRAKKRQLFAFKDPKLNRLINTRGLNSDDALPLTILPKAGIHMRTEVSEKSIWLGCADGLGRGFGLEEDPKPEEDYYGNNIYHALVRYFPCFSDVRPVNSWAGQYDINSLDETPVVYSGEGFVYVGASSGSGIMKSDALGRIAAASCYGEEETELYGGRRFRVADLGVKGRHVEHEAFVL